MTFALSDVVSASLMTAGDLPFFRVFNWIGFGTLRDQNKQSGLELAKILAVLGGLVTLFSGILAIISPFNSRVRLSDLDLMVNIATYGLLVIVLGLIAILGSKHVSSLAWGVSIVGIGLLAYRFGANYLYNLGPIMIIIAGIVAVAVRLS